MQWYRGINLTSAATWITKIIQSQCVNSILSVPSGAYNVAKGIAAQKVTSCQNVDLIIQMFM